MVLADVVAVSFPVSAALAPHLHPGRGHSQQRAELEQRRIAQDGSQRTTTIDPESGSQYIATFFLFEAKLVHELRARLEMEGLLIILLTIVLLCISTEHKKDESSCVSLACSMCV